MPSSFYLPLVLLVSLSGVGLALFAWVNRETPGAGPIALLLFAASLWTLTDALSVFSLETVFWARMKLSVSAVLPLAWLLVVVEYTGRERWLAGPRLLALLVEPLVFAALVWSNDSHHLVWETTRVVRGGDQLVFAGVEGLAFWGHLVYAYALVAIGAAILLRLLLRTDGIFRSQSTALLASIVFPMTVNALYVFDYLQPGVDPTGIAFVLTGTVLAGSMLRQHLLDVSPATRELGREEVIEQLDDPVFIVDGSGTVVDLNPAGESLLETSATEAIGRELPALLPALESALDAGGEISFESAGVRRHYDVSVSELDRAYGRVTGRIVSLRDVTERTQREQRLDVMNRLFRHNLRNEMNVVRGNAELLRSRVDDEQRERADRIITTVDEIVGRSDKVRTLSQSLEGDPSQTLDLGSILRSIVASIRSEYPDARVTLDAPEACQVTGDPSIEVAVVELMENAIEHASGEVAVSVTLTALDDTRVEVRVEDDGPGIPEQELQVLQSRTETPMEHGSGFGLWLVTWVVERVGGSIEFDVGETGTTATVRLPRAGPDD
ncbi:sensor histidine kinase [Halapricum salinum]|uniref:histidine kinase n=1 Tax=Halapricum salinum TaxID=1457250 RepID=A0A4D6HDG1_9EURY|nr:histidine kinase N-terminal 7TM domain-containing protein [Halapricum salinum]QCC51198.1 PAS domain S-box protein [Halapricum salinum]